MPDCLHTQEQKSSSNSAGFSVKLFTVIGEAWG